MREAEFRAWLDQRLWKGEPLTKKAKDNRVRRCARAERGLKGLGYEQATLEEIFDLGLWEKLIDQLIQMKDDPTVDPSIIKSVVPQAEEPSGQLSEPDPKVVEQYQHVMIHAVLARDGVINGMDWHCSR